MCLSETWLDDNVSNLEIHISNYCIQRKDRNRHGGGVCIYISQDLSYNERVYLNHEHLEATWIELLLSTEHRIKITFIVFSTLYVLLVINFIILRPFYLFLLYKCLKSFKYMFNFNRMISEYTIGLHF